MKLKEYRNLDAPNRHSRSEIEGLEEGSYDEDEDSSEEEVKDDDDDDYDEVEYDEDVEKNCVIASFMEVVFTSKAYE